jgi:ADP-dependent NAD(P)H-hydrate dehydratase / NAD(P)H-hydrate epimerase
MTPFPHGTPIYRTEEVRRIEVLAAAEPEPPELMQRAGLAAAELARELAGDSGKPIVVFAGPGNNGGDAFVLARHLKSWWFDVSVHFTGDAQKLSLDAAAAFAAWHEAGGTLTNDVPPLQRCALVVDGLFGIGLQRDLAGRYAELVSMINAAPAPILALDVPSGLHSDSGRILGCAVRASHTITFIGLKPGLLTLDGPDQSGVLHLASLGLDARAFVPSTGSVIGTDVLRQSMRPRRLNSHKGSFGSVAVVGGAAGMVGAALLAARAALKLGGGRIYVGLLDERALPVDPVQPELMVRSADAALELDQVTVLAVGPGLGVSAQSTALVAKALASTLPLVLDADALNLVATQESLSTALSTRKAGTVLTPHPAEAARLLDISTAEVQRDRVEAALNLATKHRCGVVLKGAGSVCAWPDGTWAINTSGNPGMSSAGMGDVLTGIVAALLAQGTTPEIALAAGVYLHGAAADTVVASGRGPAGLTASEIIDAARDILNREVTLAAARS